MRPTLRDLCLSFLSWVSFTEAHGYVTQVIIGDTKYKGPGLFRYQSLDSANVIRQVWDGLPIKGATNPDMTCGMQAKLADKMADAMPGDVVQVQWMGLDATSYWPHDSGPLMAYMAACGSTDCTKLEGSDANWFLVARQGQTMPIGSGYVQATLEAGLPHKFRIPSNLAPGGYLIRAEIIALHLSNEIGGAEFYSACMQVNIGGSESATPANADIVKFPGGYKDDEPGIYCPNFYNEGFVYTFPGPSVAHFIPYSSDSDSGGSSPIPSTLSSTHPQCILVIKATDADLTRRKRGLWKIPFRRWLEPSHL